MNPIIEVKNIGKKYNINHEQGRYLTLRDVFMNIIKSPFSFLKTKARQVSGFEKKEEYWALKGINFNIQKGEIVGIIGPNGAGKSTLLKILSQITPPTTGEIKINGKVGSLLEVGTGFHPELTGRENIFLNGAILGMKKSEISSRFDDIVKFAGIEKFLDTPVKYYSSGMYVRLAFSVAAHMEPDILIIDEVLAVGDIAFQKKCLGKMEELTKKDGRTILFVSHNMGAIRQLCNKAIFLENGHMRMQGETEDVIQEYFGMSKVDGEKEQSANIEFPVDANKNIQISRMRIKNEKGLITNNIPVEEIVTVEVEYAITENIDGVFFSLILLDENNQRVVDFMEIDTDEHAIKTRTKGKYTTSIQIPALLNIGMYNVYVVIERGRETLDKKNGLFIKIIDSKGRVYNSQGRAPIIPKAKWHTIQS